MSAWCKALTIFWGLSEMNEEILSTGAGIYLRPLRKSDTFLLQPLLEESESATYFTERSYTNFHDTKSLIEYLCDSGEYFLVERERDGQIIGIVGTRENKERPGVRRIAYMLGSRFRGRGIMPEVIETLTEYVLSGNAVQAIEAAIRPDNVRSLRCIEKAGYGFEQMQTDNSGGTADRKMIYIKKASK